MRIQLAAGQLYVDGVPFLIRGAEIHNSSSHPTFLANRWDAIRDHCVNTVLAAVPWGVVEPERGMFRFEDLDKLILDARARELRLVLLWFGSWKNGSSSYIPRWMKLDPDQYPLTVDESGSPLDNLSTFAAANADADAHAFAALLAHVEENDAKERTVLMVQVENEVGLLGARRDRSAGAELAFLGPVPAALRQACRAGHASSARVRADDSAAPDASWPELFGEGDATDDLFMAWQYASYIERVAAAGRSVSTLPLFVNAWLDSPPEGASALSGGQRPGEYPSGGPLPHNAVAWVTAAPTIDFLAPDVYHGGMHAWAGAYRALGRPLFVPEMRYDDEGIASVYLAIGEYGAIGTSPFGIDSVGLRGIPQLRIAYAQIAALERDILQAQRDGTIRGFAPADDGEVIHLGGVQFDVVRDEPDGLTQASAGMLLWVGDSRFILAGQNIRLQPRAGESGGRVMVLEAEELAPVDGRLDTMRHLNGDETLAGTAIRIASETSRLFGVIPSSGAVSGIVRFELYELGAPSAAS